MIHSRHMSRGATRFLLHYVRRHGVGHAVVLTAVLLAVLCSIGSQYALKHLVDVLDIGMPSEMVLWTAVAILLALVGGDNLLWRLAGWVSSYTFTAVGRDLRLDMFEYLSGHGTQYFTEQFPGALAGRVSSAATAAWTIENSLTWTTIPPALAVLTSIVMLATVNWQMMLVLTFIVLGLGLVIARFALRNRPLHGAFARQAASVSGSIADIVGNMTLVRAFGNARREQDRVAGALNQELGAQRNSIQALERLRLFHATSVFLVAAGALAWSVMLWRQGRISTGDVVLTTTISFTVLHASRDFALAMVELAQHFAKLGEAIEVVGMPHELEDATEAKALIRLGGSVSLVNVCFSYPKGERVLQDFNLHIPTGQKVGLVGRSGAGKSTIFGLIQRLYDPERGHVLIDEQDIAYVTQESLRRHIAVVQQDVAMFHRSVLDNLRYGKPEASEQEVWDAAKRAHCVDFINQLPHGLETMVGERGLRLSGGERQRLAIARAFLRDAPIILLDEATSALDTESEQLIRQALARLFEGRTVIAIAHRLSSLTAFDRIVVLERGRIVEDGPPEELLRANGRFSDMHRRQLSGHR